MSNLTIAVTLSIWAIIQIVNGDYGLAIANFILSGLNVFAYLIDQNPQAKQAFKEFEKIFFELYGKDDKNE